ncbi:preprotein translocase subunit SecG [Luteibacter sp. Sphag1AF]|uniref:preprotein translocase subunit SecG n=1 Tax=Luteibacter sp. Sphag1AF TaxID=2587031 RepID=UPI0016165F4E|nr:preprotein translocase subunit SecG [Luteibacter sp. Sphag1AF]MBB3228773.1 preprotein translocase subunit SecG [Luteibacter sp. Sphag1AF]
MFIIFSVFYILIAAAMIVLILMQRGAGADAGSGFGGGASATVFGARGSSSFMTRATGILAALFFVLSLGMGIYLGRTGNPQPAADLGVMSGLETPKAPAAGNTPAAPAAADVPKAAPAANGDVPAADPAKK